ncbi:MAG TPA: GH116 family glycosyl hydrolase [Terriglobia bacterium]|nr:GH116 family glycosyl hydrolase [Terriglobia bacterium]
MKRRDLLTALGGATVLGLSSGAVSAQNLTEPGLLASEGVAENWPPESAGKASQWTMLRAEGFAAPVPALVFNGGALAEGVPLGGLGTGYMTLEGNGKIGFHSIFNNLVPPKKYFQDWLTVNSGTVSVPLSSTQISYWGHFPVVDLQAAYQELPLKTQIRAFTPYIVGDAAASNTPVVLFDLKLQNTSSRNLPLKLNLKFPAPPEGCSLAVRGQGIVVRDQKEGLYLLETSVPAGKTQRLRFAVGWHSPYWHDSGGELRVNRYSQRFESAEAAADFGLRRHDVLLRRVLAWQGEIYRSSLPDWLKDALVQGLYSHAKNSVWIARTRDDDWWGEDGWFTHSESHTGCPIVETMVCRMHGHFPLLFFYPELEATTLNAFRHFQISDGEIPFCFGMPTSMRDPRHHCQHPLNSGQYAQMVYRLYLRTGDREQLAHYYESAKRAIRYLYLLDNDHCGLVHDQPHVLPGGAWPANQFYDCWPWHGVSSYVAGTWLGTLAAGKLLAGVMGDHEFVAECTERLRKAQDAFNQRLWTGSYYRLWNDVKTGKQNDVLLSNQLMGEWCAKVAGLEGVLPQERVRSALGEISRLNLKATSYGLINGVTPDGKPYDTKVHPEGDFGLNIFVGENLCAAMTFLYEGQRDTGLEIARRLYEAMAVKARSPWNQRCLLNGQTGLPLWGDDYYSNLAMWVVPMALAGQSVAEFTSSGLAKKMIDAASREKA